MKKTILFAAILLVSFMYQTATSQVRVGLNINLGVQPVWGPVGYDYADYYYMPDIDVFYNIPRRQYIYLQQGRWIFSASLPYRYRNFDLYTGYKVVVNDSRPYRHAQTYRTKYARYKGDHSQEAIRNSHDSRYFVNKDHPEHNKWREDNNHHQNGNANQGNHNDNGDNHNNQRGNNDNHGNKGHEKKQDH
ncbi:MAG: hypothetical protein Q8891_09115 [Bacteroidota bacterium]|nr:hypothetical protein [Bacteroidota bacterium]